MNAELMNRIGVVDTGSVDLDKDVVYINDQIKAGRKSSHEVARTLLKIRTEGLFTVCSDSFSNFCSDFFGINKATGSKLCAVAERFLTDDTYADYSISKLMEMRGATSEQLALIKPEMTVAQIREILSPKPAIEDKSEDKSEDTAEDTAESCDITTKTKTEPHYVQAGADSNPLTPAKIVGDGFEIELADDGKHWVCAKIHTVLGMKNYAEYILTLSKDPHTFDDDINITIEFKKVWLDK